VFGIVVAVAVQNVFCLEMHQNKVFFLKKKLFLTSAHQNNLKKKIHFKHKKKIQNLRERGLHRIPKHTLSNKLMFIIEEIKHFLLRK